MLKRLEALSRWIGIVEQVILVVCLTVMILFAFTQVLLRFLPGAWSVTWLEPVARQLVLWVGLLGASFATAEGRHISIEALPMLMNAKQKKWLGVGLHLISAVLALVLGLLAWTWFIEIDRKEISEAHEISHLLKARADTYSGQSREEVIAGLRSEAEKRINSRRLKGFAKLIRNNRVTTLKLNGAEESDYILAARALMKGDERLARADLKTQASFETVEWIAVKFDQASAAYSKGDDRFAKVAFADRPANAEIADAMKDPISQELYSSIVEIQKKKGEEPKNLLIAKADLKLRMADQKALFSIGSIHFHEWWFHLVIPVALFVMTFRFLINSLSALVLSPEDYEKRAETLQKDIEAFEAGGQSGRIAGVSADDEPEPAKENDHEPVESAATKSNPEAQAPFPKPFDPDDEVPIGALETVDLPQAEGLFDEVDKAPPPRTRSGLVPKQESVFMASEDLLAVEADSAETSSGEDTNKTDVLDQASSDDAKDSEGEATGNEDGGQA
jgi:TRAP-type C4-dicarboxylate transport system permease small subunit